MLLFSFLLVSSALNAAPIEGPLSTNFVQPADATSLQTTVANAYTTVNQVYNNFFMFQTAIQSANTGQLTGIVTMDPSMQQNIASAVTGLGNSAAYMANAVAYSRNLVAYINQLTSCPANTGWTCALRDTSTAVLQNLQYANSNLQTASTSIDQSMFLMEELSNTIMSSNSGSLKQTLQNFMKLMQSLQNSLDASCITLDDMTDKASSYFMDNFANVGNNCGSMCPYVVR